MPQESPKPPGALGRVAIVLIAAAVVPGAAQAQAAATSAAPDGVMAVVRTLFDGMREADSTKVRSVFAEGARFASVAPRAASEAVQYASVDGFVASVGRSERRWDERLYEVEVRVDGGMAVVWAPYTFYLDGQVRHCGVNVMDFLRANGSWKITQLTDTRRTEGCRQIPPGAGGDRLSALPRHPVPSEERR
jgi:hypothetical protein